MALPDFVIIGAMKCGTSTLHAQLAAQPGVFMSEPKEPNFFSDDDVFARGIGWYESLFAAAPPGALKGESSTHYTKLPTHPQAAPRLAAALPGARLIYLMRDPVERLISHYIHEWSMGKIDCDLETAITRHPELLAYSRYATQLAPWQARFAPDRLLLLRLEDMEAAPQATLDRVAAFLGRPGAFTWVAEQERQNVSAERIRSFPFYQTLVESAPATFLRRTLVPKALRRAVKARFQMRERPAIPDDLRARLAAELAREVPPMIPQG